MSRSNRQARDRLPFDIANQNDQEHGATRLTEPKSNVFGSAWLSMLEYLESRLALPRWGQIVDFVPMYNAYRVQAEHGGIFICTFGSVTGDQPTGSRQGNSLPIGSGVIFLPPSQGHYGLILCIDPGYITDGRNVRSDFIVQGGHTGLYSDTAHDAILSKLQFQGGMACFNGGRPFDSTSGELNFSTETGLMLHQDPFMSFMRVDEVTGLWLYYLDQLTRLSGHNLQIRSVLGEREELDDQQEAISIHSESPYPWETLGVWNWCQAAHRELTQEEIQTNSPEYSLLEPAFDDQKPFRRIVRFGGYLGQGGKEVICLPPYPAEGIANRYSTPQKYIGVLNIQKGLDGSYGVKGRRISLVKSPCIPVPDQVIRPEDERGDNEANYKAAGLFGADEAEDHILAGEFSNAQGPEELVRASSILDLNAFTFNWQGLHPFFYHQFDWYLPEECDGTLGVGHAPIFFCALQNSQRLTAPIPTQLRVDHRTVANYYPNESYIVLLEDGGLVISDGFGFELRATGGDVDISTPGDINLRPGRNFNVWAGWDAVVRANNSADVTANIGDVRLKAQHNVEILGGNDQWGGVLIESKAQCPTYDFSQIGQKAEHSGIMLISKNAPIVTYGADLWQQSKAGHMYFVAGDTGTNDVKFYYSNLMNFIGSAKFDFFPETTNEYWQTHTLFGSALRLHGQTVIESTLVVGNWITVINGHIATTLANDPGVDGQVSAVPGGSTAPSELAYIDTRLDYLTDLMAAVNGSAFETALSNQVKAAQFSLRTVSDYKTTGYTYFETRWQQLARMTNEVPALWLENPVSTSIGNTYPHPGNEVLNGNAWYTQDLSLYNPQVGSSIDREANQSDYESPQYGTTTLTILNGNYPIVRNA